MAGVPRLKHLNFPMRIKLAVRNGMFLRPSWFEALLTSPEPADEQPKLLEREIYPEDRYRVEFMKKYPQRWIVNKKNYETYVTFMRNVPEDNRWFKDPTVYYAMRKLAYVQRGYSEKEATELVERDFEAKKLELEYGRILILLCNKTEKEVATRQSTLTGSKRSSAFELLQETETRLKVGADEEARRKALEKTLAPKKEAIRMGIAPRLTPRDIKPQDADFYLKYHPYDKPYFDMTSFLRYRAQELREKIDQKLSQEQEFFSNKVNEPGLSKDKQAASITSGLPKVKSQ